MSSLTPHWYITNGGLSVLKDETYDKTPQITAYKPYTICAGLGSCHLRYIGIYRQERTMAQGLN